MEIPARNSVMVCMVVWPEKYVGFSALTVSFLSFMCESFSCQRKEKTSCLFLESSLPSSCASIQREHHPGSSWLQVMRSSSSPLGPSQSLASLLSVAVTSWHREKNGLMTFSIHLMAFCLWLQGTPGSQPFSVTPLNIYIESVNAANPAPALSVMSRKSAPIQVWYWCCPTGVSQLIGYWRNLATAYQKTTLFRHVLWSL